MTEGSPEYQKEVAELNKLVQHIKRLAQFAQRNATNDAAVNLHLSQMFQEADDMPQAREFILKALQLSPDDPKILRQAAFALESEEKPDEQLQAAKRLCEVEPDSPPNHVLLGFLYRRRGDIESAKAHFIKAVDAPGISDSDRAPMLMVLGRGKEAAPLYKNLADDPKNKLPDGGYNLTGMAYMIMSRDSDGDQEGAIEWFARLITLEPRAAIADNIKLATIPGGGKEVLLRLLDSTLAKHPELAPKPDPQ
jgi:tetratricopeptide (TPR) repeat protein